MPKAHIAHASLDLVPIPELDIKAGDQGGVDFVYEAGRGLHVETPAARMAPLPAS